MKVNISPEMVTSEMTVKFKKPSLPNKTYKAVAEITDVSAVKVMIKGDILTTNDKGEYTEVVVTATCTCVMLDKLQGKTTSKSEDRDDGNVISAEQCLADSLKLQALRAEGGQPPPSLPPPPPTAASASTPPLAPWLPTNTADTLKALKQLQEHLVSQLQTEYFCDDVEPPEEAFGWSAKKLTEYFANGGA